jgi:alpha-L-rhamnosidase
LCKYNSDGKDKTDLPSYVTFVNYYKVKGNGMPLNLTNDSKTNDRRALAPDPNNGYPRTAAGLFAMDGDQIGYTFTSTIAIKGEHNYRVSLYFLDWDNTGKPIEVEIFDAQTSNIIAPAKIINSCTGGVYLTYTYNRPVKFRINMSPNNKAVLSGIFFDKIE